MINKVSSNITRQKRHLRIRQNVKGTSLKPRLCVFRSNKQIYAQLIDDEAGKTLAQASTLEIKDLKNGGNVEAATEVGTLMYLIVVVIYIMVVLKP